MAFVLFRISEETCSNPHHAFTGKKGAAAASATEADGEDLGAGSGGDPYGGLEPGDLAEAVVKQV